MVVVRIMCAWLRILAANGKETQKLGCAEAKRVKEMRLRVVSSAKTLKVMVGLWILTLNMMCFNQGSNLGQLIFYKNLLSYSGE